MKTLKDKIAVMTAYENGEQIEVRSIKSNLWYGVNNPEWDWHYYDYRVKESFEYVDLGLPSGTLWARENARHYHNFAEATNTFGDSLPSKEDFEELLECCYSKWDKQRKGIEFLSTNGETLFFPAMGYSTNSICLFGELGYYWSSTPADNLSASVLYFFKRGPMVTDCKINSCVSVRLIKRK